MPLHALNVNMIMFAMSYMMYNYDMRANWLKFWQRSNPVTKISHFRDSIHTHTHPHMHTQAHTHTHAHTRLHKWIWTACICKSRALEQLRKSLTRLEGPLAVLLPLQRSISERAHRHLWFTISSNEETLSSINHEFSSTRELFCYTWHSLKTFSTLTSNINEKNSNGL